MFGPSFSPEGSYVAFSAYDDSTANVSRVKVQRIYNIDDDNPYLVTSGPPDEEHTDVAWHPRGNIILYTARTYTDDPADSDGIESSGIKAVKFVPNTNPPNGAWQYWPIVDAETDKDIGEAHWSGNGSQVVYTEGGLLKVINMNATGHPTQATGVDITPIKPGGQKIHAASPRFSPDGNQIAVIDWDTDDLWVTRPTNPAGAYKVTRIGDVYGYNWSPGGENFVYSTWEDQQLQVVSSTGGEPKNITPAGFRAWSTPSWWSQ